MISSVGLLTVGMIHLRSLDLSLTLGRLLVCSLILSKECAKLTIEVLVVFMAGYIMVLRGATSLRGALEGVGPEN